jgi:hypothetical protein
MQGRRFFQISLCGSRFDSCPFGPDVIENECGDEEANKDNLTFQTVECGLSCFHIVKFARFGVRCCFHQRRISENRLGSR